MQKSLLLTVSDSPQSQMAVRFVRSFFSDLRDVELTLFYVEPKKDDSSGRPAQAAGRSLEEAKTWLLEMGAQPSLLKTKLAQNKLGVVKDIVHEAVEGQYDAVVLGRRGMNWFDELFTDSISHRILWEGFYCPVWVCRYPIKGRKNVLLCVDGSEQSMSAADHVGFILRDEPSHDVTIFHVSPDGECDLECMGKAVEIMAANGLGDSRIRQGCARSKHPATAILDEAASGEYAAVAIGRSGGKPEGVLGHIFGATGLKLLRNLEGAALWISR